jgi:hypothetical protein
MDERLMTTPDPMVAAESMLLGRSAARSSSAAAHAPSNATAAKKRHKHGDDIEVIKTQ